MGEALHDVRGGLSQGLDDRPMHLMRPCFASNCILAGVSVGGDELVVVTKMFLSMWHADAENGRETRDGRITWQQTQPNLNIMSSFGYCCSTGLPGLPACLPALRFPGFVCSECGVHPEWDVQYPSKLG